MMARTIIEDDRRKLHKQVVGAQKLYLDVGRLLGKNHLCTEQAKNTFWALRRHYSSGWEGDNAI